MLSIDPIQSAKAMGLRYVNDEKPGIQRKRVGEEFIYLDAKDNQVCDPEDLERIKNWSFHRHGQRFGFVHYRMDIYKQQVGMLKDVSNTAIILSGAGFEIRRSSIEWFDLVLHYLQFESRPIATCS